MSASARRKGAIKTPGKTPGKAASAAVRLARGDELAGVMPVRDQHLMIEAAFSAPVDRPYPPMVKAALFIGAPTVLWAAIIYAGAQILRLAAR